MQKPSSKSSETISPQCLTLRPRRLQRVDGIGENAAVLMSLMPRLFDSYQSSRWLRHETFASTQAAVSYLNALLGTQRNEVFCVLALDSQNRLIAVEQVQKGQCKQDGRLPEAGRRGEPEAPCNRGDFGSQPSGRRCVAFLRRQAAHAKLRKILGDLDIVVHDHIIVAGHNQYYSFAESGGLE